MSNHITPKTHRQRPTCNSNKVATVWTIKK